MRNARNGARRGSYRRRHHLCARAHSRSPKPPPRAHMRSFERPHGGEHLPKHLWDRTHAAGFILRRRAGCRAAGAACGLLCCWGGARAPSPPARAREPRAARGSCSPSHLWQAPWLVRGQKGLKSRHVRPAAAGAHCRVARVSVGPWRPFFLVLFQHGNLRRRPGGRVLSRTFV